VSTRKKPKGCRDLICEHPKCAHGRPHCPACPPPGVAKLSSLGHCAACSGRPPVTGGNVCQACRDQGMSVDSLFDGPQADAQIERELA